MSPTNPFSPSTSKPGHGSIIVAILPPCTPALQTVSYQYPLKLIAPDAVTVHGSILVHAVFLLTYGGGLVAGDQIDLHVQLGNGTRLTLLTQGSTKIFKTPSRDIESGQRTIVDLEQGAALCYIPDPVQPFERSAFSQTQIYKFGSIGDIGEPSMCVCDWVCQGRSALGENWDFYKYTSKNEVWLESQLGPSKGKLLLRDNLILDNNGIFSNGLVERMDELGVFGTLIIRGPMFERLGKYFLDEFERLPRIGGRKWDTDTDQVEASKDEVARLHRQKQETADRLLWTAAHIRGFVLVKFGARQVEGAKRWLTAMMKSEGTVPREFGERSLLCLK
jgi:urease accessory protein